ncbi:hypothetical protein CXK86_20410 [Paenibacillus sp. BGI2013]|nr:hypothetical protein CXK86_20410 [Paenibacillus sp. BGI2013]
MHDLLLNRGGLIISSYIKDILHGIQKVQRVPDLLSIKIDFERLTNASIIRLPAKEKGGISTLIHSNLKYVKI